MFDGLLDEPHNTCVLKLLFDLAHWHGLAKLHMHTDTTLDILADVTTSLGRSLRAFEGSTCSAFPTRELERERAARQRRQEPEKGQAKKTGNSTRKPKQLNLKTYKFHSLGDYVETIRRFGTTDSYSTQSVGARLIKHKIWLIQVVSRVNLSIERLNPVTFGLVVNQYHSNYHRLNDDSAVSK